MPQLVSMATYQAIDNVGLLRPSYFWTAPQHPFQTWSIQRKHSTRAMVFNMDVLFKASRRASDRAVSPRKG